jgi:serine protease Do
MGNKKIVFAYKALYTNPMTHEKQVIEAVRKVMPAVVSISAAKDIKIVEEEQRRNPQEYNLPAEEIRQLPTDENNKIKIGGGSGFIVDESGLILTNKHVVIDPAAEYTAVLADDRRFVVRAVARDPIHDIAILKITSETSLAGSLPSVKLATTEGLDLGQTVIAIGNALGEFQNTVSTGVVSGLSRLVSAVTDISGHQERLRGLIQTDAAINPGNSGGPLINLKGEAIGINAAIVFGAQNIGFAIPIKKAKRDLADIKKYGRIRRPFLGVRYLLINDEIAKRFKLPIGRGALVLKEAMPGDHAVIPGSSADKAGIHEGDILLTFNEHPITEKTTLEDMLEGLRVGEEIVVSFLRNGTQELKTTIRLQER